MKLKLSEAFVEKLIARAKRTPYFHLPGYMERYWLLPYKKFREKRWQRILFGPIAARIHHILRSDDDRAFHSHPWDYATLILRGGYWEIKPIFDAGGFYKGETRKWYGAGSIRFAKSRTLHRLEVPEGMSAWTLFVTFRYKHNWGFMRDVRNMVPYKEYLGIAEDAVTGDSADANK